MYQSFEDLEVWKKPTQLAIRLYSLLKDCRDYGLKDQMPRAAVSIPLFQGAIMNKYRKLILFKKWLGFIFSKKYIDNPIFIVGCGRSGTTALCVSLNQHHKLLVQSKEGPMLSPIGNIIYDYAYGENSNYVSRSTSVNYKYLKRTFKYLCMELVFGREMGLIQWIIKLKTNAKVF